MHNSSCHQETFISLDIFLQWRRVKSSVKGNTTCCCLLPAQSCILSVCN